MPDSLLKKNYNQIVYHDKTESPPYCRFVPKVSLCASTEIDLSLRIHLNGFSLISYVIQK